MSGLEGLLLEPLLGAATGASKGLYKLIKKVRNAPKEFQELVEEIQQLRVVIHSIQNANIQEVALPEMSAMVLEAKEKLLDIDRAVAFRLAKPEDDDQIDRLHWARRSEEAKKLLDDLQKLTSKLTALLGVANLSSQSRLMNHMEQQHAASQAITMEVRQLARVTVSRDNQDHNVLATLENQNQLLGAMFARIEQSASTQERLEQHFGQFILEQRPLPTSPFSSELAVNKSSGRKSLTAPSRGDSLRYTAIRNSGNECPKGCRCACHKPMRLQTPWATRRWTGAMQIQCSNFSWFRNNCNIKSCKRSALTSVTVQYTLPVWVAGKMVAAFYKSAPLSGPELLFKVARVHYSSVFYYAQEGDLKSIQALYSSGEASIHDVNPITGNSALLTAVEYNAYDVMAFLVEWGANMEHQDHAGGSASTHMLATLISSRKRGFVHHPFDAIADLDDLVYNAGFTSIHKIVCGLTIGDLQNELENHPELIDKQDNRGWTPLFWAVFLDDVDMIHILLEHKADVSHVDTSGYIVLTLCGDNIHTLQSVLEALPASGTNIRQLINQHSKYGNTPWHLVETGGALSLYIEHGCDLSLPDGRGRTVLHLAMLDGRDASFAEALMAPDVKAEMKAVDLEARDIYGDTAYEDYESYYPTRRAKRTREGRAKLALLKYVESLRDGGDGSRIREVEEGDEEGSSDSDSDSDYHDSDAEEEDEDDDEEQDGNDEEEEEDEEQDGDDEDEDGQNNVPTKLIGGSGQKQEQHATGDGKTSEEELSDDEPEAFEDALDHLELLGEA